MSPGVVESDGHITPVGHLKSPGELAQQLRQIDRLSRFLLDLFADHRDFPKARHQPLQPADIAGQELEKALAIGIVVGNRHHFGSRADGRERILELVRDIGRERLHELDMIVDATRHLLERTRERAELVRASCFGKTPGSGMRRSANADARARRRLSGPTIVIDAIAVSTDAVSTDATTTRKMRKRTSYSACRMRNVDCETSTAPDDGLVAAHRQRAEHRHRSLSGRRPGRRSVPAGERSLHFRLVTGRFDNSGVASVDGRSTTGSSWVMYITRRMNWHELDWEGNRRRQNAEWQNAKCRSA